MSLPTIPTPVFELTIPSTGETVEYRPFLTGEHKLLMIAMETGDDKEVELATYQIVGRCLFGKVDVKKLAAIDMEYIFLKLRAKSIGEVVELDVKCESCEKVNDYSLDISKIEPSGALDKNVKLEDNFGMVLRYPTAEESSLLNTNMTVENVYAVLVDCIEQIYTQDAVYLAKDYTRVDIDTWMEKLSTQHFEKLELFFNNIPKLTSQLRFKCSKCGVDNDITVEGIASFFG